MMPISDRDPYEKGHFKEVYEHLLSPAIRSAGYEPFRADENRAANWITIEVVRRVIQAPMALCDLSGLNPNVLFELGIRQAYQKPVALVIDDETESPFDVAQLRAFTYGRALRIGQATVDLSEIKEAVRATAEEPSESSLSSIARLAAATIASKPMDPVSYIDMLRREVSLLRADVQQITHGRGRGPQPRQTEDHLQASALAMIEHGGPFDDARHALDPQSAGEFGPTLQEAAVVIKKLGQRGDPVSNVLASGLRDSVEQIAGARIRLRDEPEGQGIDPDELVG